MLKIGVTGGIGSGKTTICKVFELLGIPVFYADTAARQVMQTDPILIAGLKVVFGEESYLADGSLNRKYISSLVFADSQQLTKLNSLVHPAVFRAFDEWVLKQNAPYVLKEAALLFESNSYLDCNYTILVSSPMDLRIKRVIDRDKISREEVINRISRQLPEEQKEKLADVRLLNDETHFLISEILHLHNRFLAESTSK